MYENDLRGPPVGRQDFAPRYDRRAADARTATVVMVLTLAILVGTLAFMAGLTPFG